MRPTLAVIATALVAACAPADDLPAAAEAPLAVDPPGASGEPDAEPVLLVYTVSAGYEHPVVRRPEDGSWSLVEQALAHLGERSERFDVVVSRDAAHFTPDGLDAFDGVFFYTTGELPLGDDGVAALLTFVEAGGAFVGAHCATDTFYDVPAFGEMVGAYFDGHPWNREVVVEVEATDHPATGHLGDAFAITDEIYQFKEPYDRSRLDVLLSLDTSSVPMDAPGIARDDGDFAIAWTREHGDGRVFYTALGHGPDVWADGRFHRHLVGGIEWALDVADAEAP